MCGIRPVIGLGKYFKYAERSMALPFLKNKGNWTVNISGPGLFNSG